MNKFATIPEAIEELKKGRMLILVDDPQRENEGDIYIPTDKLTPQHVITMIKKGGGLICTAITLQQATRLSLPLMVPAIDNTEKTRVSFTVSVNARQNISTGVSAFDRTETIKVLANPTSKPADIVRPGHVFGLIAKAGGVLERRGHTEAAVDLAKLLGYTPAGVLCEIVGQNGEMAKYPELYKLSKELNIKIISITDLVEYVKQQNIPQEKPGSILVCEATSYLPTPYGDWKIIVYRSIIDNLEHTVLIMGDPGKNPVLTRIHSQCLTGDTFSSERCDCQAQLHKSMELISEKGEGIILYLNQEGRGIGLTNKIRAYALQDKGLDTVEANEQLDFPADARNYNVAAEMLCELGFHTIDLLTNNPEKTKSLKLSGVTINRVVPIEMQPNQHNRRYLATKREKMGHVLKKA